MPWCQQCPCPGACGARGAHGASSVPVPTQGDVGGARTLQKKWTSFLKARLVCSAPEQQLHFNRLQAVFTLPGTRWQDTAFFGVFQARWSVLTLPLGALFMSWPGALVALSQ